MPQFNDRIQNAVSDALQRYESGMNEPFPARVQVEVIERRGFGARVFPSGAGYIIEIHSSVQNEIDHLWHQAWQSTVLIGDAGSRIKYMDGSDLSLEQLAHLSLTWLILHELMHIRLGHLDLLNSAQLVETEGDENSPASWEHPGIADIAAVLSFDERQLFRPCLELQADNDATEVMFGVYDESEWDRFRIEAAAIFVVMALMETAGWRAVNSNKIYPRVATRFFTLFAQLFQYWLYPAGAELRAGVGESFVSPPRKPEGKEFERYMKFVLAFTVSDAVQIALWADARNFLIDLGQGSALFKDIFEIQYSTDLASADLATNAAREWRELLPVNEKIMAATGLRI